MKARLRLIEYDPVCDVYQLEASSPGLDRVENFIFLDYSGATNYLDETLSLATQKAHIIEKLTEADVPDNLMWVYSCTQGKELWETHGLTFWRINDIYLRVAAAKKGHLVYAFSTNARWWPHCKGPSFDEDGLFIDGDMYLMDGVTTCVHFNMPVSDKILEFMRGQTAAGLYATSAYIWMDGDMSRFTIQIGKRACSWMGHCEASDDGLHTFTTEDPSILNFNTKKRGT